MTKEIYKTNNLSLTIVALTLGILIVVAKNSFASITFYQLSKYDSSKHYDAPKGYDPDNPQDPSETTGAIRVGTNRAPIMKFVVKGEEGGTTLEELTVAYTGTRLEDIVGEHIEMFESVTGTLLSERHFVSEKATLPVSRTIEEGTTSTYIIVLDIAYDAGNGNEVRLRVEDVKGNNIGDQKNLDPGGFGIIDAPPIKASISSGKIVISGSSSNEIIFECTAIESMGSGGAISFTVPTDWTRPQGTKDQRGYTYVESDGDIGSPTYKNGTMEVSTRSLSEGQRIRIHYGYGGGSSGVVAPAIGEYDFMIEAKQSKPSGSPFMPLMDDFLKGNLSVRVIKVDAQIIEPDWLFTGSVDSSITTEFTVIGTIDGGGIRVGIPEQIGVPTLDFVSVETQGNARIGELSIDAQKVIIPIKKMEPDDKILVSYSNFAAPSNETTLEFLVEISGDGQNYALIDTNPTLNVVQFDGKCTISPESVTAESVDVDIVFEFTPDYPMDDGLVQITIPVDFPSPQTGNSDKPGYVETTLTDGIIGALVIDGNLIQVPVIKLESDKSISVNYENVVIPDKPGTVEFELFARGSEGELSKISDSPSLIINQPVDAISPSVVTNLSASNPTPDSITLTWTAPGDDGDVGMASQYDIRYSTSLITDDSWDAATECQSEPTPQVAGSTETFTVTNLSPSTTYYFAIKTADEALKWSQISNIAQGTTMASIAHLAFTSATQDVPAGFASAPITIEAQDASSTPVTATNDLTITLESDSGTGSFSTTSDFAAAVTEITLPSGKSSVDFYYKDTAISGAKITARTTDLAPVEHDISIIEAITSIRVDGSPAKAGDTITITAENVAGATGGTAIFSIGSKIVNQPMTEVRSYSGTYTVKADDDVTDVTVTVTLNGVDYEADDKVTIDTVTPEATLILIGDKGENDWYISDVIADIESSDSGTGVESEHIKVDDGSWQTLPVTITTEGIHTVEFYAKDYAGSESSKGSVSVKVDKSKPSPPNISSSTHTQNEWSKNDSPEFSWTEPSDTSGISGVSLELDKNPSTTPDETVDVESSGTSKNYKNLDNADNWYFHVRAKDNAGWWGDASHFGPIKIDAASPSLPAVVDDGDYTTSVTQLHASWASTDEQSGISEYQYAIGTSIGSTDVVNWTSVGTDTEVTATGLSLTNDQIYYFNVKAKSIAGLWSDVGFSDGITVDSTPPDVPILVSYTPNPTSNTKPTLDWNDVESAVSYHLQIDDNADFSSPLVNEATLTSSVYTVTTALPEKLIYWRVKSKDAAGNESDFSEADSFTVDVTPPAVPTLVPYAQAPTNNTKPTLDWNDVEDASTYHIQIDDNSDFSSPIVDDDTLTSSAYTLTAPLPEKLIYWRVKSKDEAGNESKYSEFDTFTIDLTLPEVPTLVTYTPDPTSNRKPSLDWNDVEGAVSYHLQIDDNADFSSPLVNEATLTSSVYTVETALPEKPIYWRVKSKDAAGNESEYSQADSFTIDITPPAVPALIEYTPDPTNDNTPTLDWNDVEDAATYHIQIGNDAGFSSPIVDDNSLTSSTYTPATALPEGIIYWRVKSKDTAGNERDFSAPDSFTIDTTPPATPTALQAISGDSQVSLGWNANTESDLSHYKIYRSTNSGFAPTPGDFINRTDKPNTTFTDTGLANGTTYYYRISAVDSAENESKFSDEVTAMPIAPIDHLAFISATQDVPAGFASAPITIEAQDASSNPITATNNLTITLESDSGTGSFSTRSDLAATVTEITLPSDKSSVDFYYKDTAISDAKITARMTDFNPVVHNISIIKAITSISVEGSPAKAGDTITITTEKVAGAIGGTAKFSIGSKIVKQSMGSYSGTYTVKAGDDVNDATVTVTLNGVDYYAADKVTLDTVEPDAGFILSGSKGVNDWYISNVTVDIESSDSGSGVKSERIKVDSGSWDTPPVTITTEGIHTVEFYAKDYAGNESSKGSVSVKVDKSKPPPPNISSSTHTQNEWSKNDSPEFSWTEPDDTSGISGYSYILDGDASTVPDEHPEGPSRSKSYTDIADGVWYFHIRAKDNAGHWGEAAHYEVKIDIDDSPPNPNIIIGISAVSADSIKITSEEAKDDTPPVYYRLDGQYFNGLTWTDNGGGVSDYDYSTTRPNPWADTGLVENGLYHYRQKVKDSVTPTPNESDWSPWVENSTLLNPPKDTEITFSDITTNGIYVNLVPPPKPSGTGSTGAYFDLITGEGQGNGATDRGYADDYTAEYSDLKTNTQYGWKVKYRNRDGVETDYNKTEQKRYTLIETPAGVDFGTVTPSSIEIKTTGALSNLGVDSSGVYFDSTTPGGDGGIKEWIKSTSDTATGLSPNTKYTFHVKARNGDDVETDYSPSASKYTLANTPSASTVRNPTKTTLDVDVNPGDNPAHTEFAIYNITDGYYVDANGGNNGDDPFWQTDSKWGTVTVKNLKPNTEYTFRVKAKNGDGVETGFGLPTSVPTPPNRPPVAVIAGDAQRTAKLGEDVEFDSEGSSDPDGKIVSFGWDFGDGETGQGEKVTHAYAKAGKYTVTLTMTDDKGATGKATVKITIVQPPKANFTFSPSEPREGLDMVTFKDISTTKEEITYQEWDFGDGTTSTEKEPKHTFSADGIYEVTLQVLSSNGLESNITKNVNITNVPPTATIVKPSTPPTIVEGSTVSFTGDFTDPGSDDVNPTFDWDFGDGTEGRGKAAPHKYIKSGTFTVTLTVTDSDGAKGKSNMLVTVIRNTPPTKPEVILKPEEPFLPLDTLKAMITKPSSDDDDDAITYTYEWFKNKTLIKTEQTQKTELSFSHPFTEGEVWHVKVTPNDGESDGEAATSPSVTIKPVEERLFHNYPNPFNPSNGTTFVYYLKRQASSVVIRVYDLRGKLIRKLRGKTQRGCNEAFWDGKDEKGDVIPSSVFFCHVEIFPEGEWLKPNPLKIVAWR